MIDPEILKVIKEVSIAKCVSYHMDSFRAKDTWVPGNRKVFGPNPQYDLLMHFIITNRLYLSY